MFAPLCLTGLLAALVLLEPDLGTTLLFGVLALALMWVGGSSSRWLAIIVALGALIFVAAIVAIFQFNMFHDSYQVKRLLHWWYQDDPSGSNYQQHISMIALGSGGIYGDGLGNSRMKMAYLPEVHTDFIFPIIGEELGLVGTLGVVAAICVLIGCGLFLASRAPDFFGLLLGTGIMVVVGLQSMINLAVVTNSIPNKGMPLPFISYGGSTLVMTLGALGILVNIALQTYSRACKP